MDLLTHALAGALVGQALSPPTPAAQSAGAALGAIAAVLPDLDAAAELWGKEAAWRYHRVLFHGLPGTIPMAAVAAAGEALTTTALTPATAFAVAWLSLLTHLLLDVLTSFGTCVFYPCSQRRCSTRSHFIVDPVLLALAGWGVWTAQALPALAAIAAWLGVTLGLRALVVRRAAAALRRLGRPVARFSVEPRIAAPFQWLVVAQLGAAPGSDYLHAMATPWSLGRWQQTDSGCDAAMLQRLRQHPVLAAFLDTCDYPRLQWQGHLGPRRLLVEDLKWWLHPPWRPLAFEVQLGADGLPQQVRQGGLLHRASTDVRPAEEGRAAAYHP